MKLARHSKIIEFVNKHDIETQEELSQLLKDSGYKVTQATISRDIRELGLTKMSESGKQIYRILNKSESDFSNKFIQILTSGYISMDMAQNMVVIKTVSGMAMAVAAAIDSMSIPGIIGCIAGDDTIMCAVKTEEEAPRVMEDLNRLMNSHDSDE